MPVGKLRTRILKACPIHCRAYEVDAIVTARLAEFEGECGICLLQTRLYTAMGRDGRKLSVGGAQYIGQDGPRCGKPCFGDEA